MALLSIMLPVIALALGWVSELHQRHTLARRLDLLTAQRDTTALARSHAYIAAFDAAARRYQDAVRAYHQAESMEPGPARDAIARAATGLDRLRDAWADDGQ